jgi:hypothetical protein
MKKMMMLAAMMVATITASAQFEPGTISIQPKVGGVISKVSNMPKVNFDFSDLGGHNYDIDKSFYGGALIGAEFEYQITNQFSAAAGLNYSMQGCQWEDFELRDGNDYSKVKDLQIELGYLNLPVVANFYLFKGFAIKTGVQFGFLLSAKCKATNELKLDGVNSTRDYSMDIKDNYNKLDISIPIGASYQVPTVPIYIDARYNLGLTKLQKELSAGEEANKNQVFQLTVGYKFAL